MAEQATERTTIAAPPDVVYGTALDIESRVTSSCNECGLLGIALHPKFPSNGRYFVNYTARRPELVRSVVAHEPPLLSVVAGDAAVEPLLRATAEAGLTSTLKPESSPLVDARLPDGSRVNAIIPPLSLSGPLLTIRKFAQNRFAMDELVEIDTLSAESAEFLEMCVRAELNILISGGTGSGKTTFLNALSAAVPDSDRIVIWYAPLGETGYFIPYRVLLGTNMGDLSMVLTKMEF